MEVRVNLENEFLIYIINSPVTCSLTLAYISSWASLVAQMLKKSESESHSILPWTLSDPRDYAVHRILHTRILEWVPFSFSRWSSWPRDIALQEDPLPAEPQGKLQTVKNLPAMQETWILSLVWENPLEKELATHFSILAWRIMTTRAWRATVHEVAESQTQLTNPFTLYFFYKILSKIP